MAQERNGERIGLIGPGRMGLAMVKHLTKAGYAVTATDRDTAQLDKARAAGAAAAPTAAEVGRRSDFVIVAVGFDDEVVDVVSSKDGLLGAMAPGGVVAVCSTAAPQTIIDLANSAAKKGVEVLDAPICRGRWSADEGTLLALLGGKPAVVERALPIFRCFASDIEHLGDVGHGQVGKAMNNYLLWVNGIALIEAGRLAASTGIDLSKLRKALLMSSGKSAALEDWDLMTFTWAHKDMQIVSRMADAAGLSLPIAGAIRELVKDGKRIKATNPPDWTGQAGVTKLA
jgi:3-hydroxyisobutyrate dehydrogenase/2-hydroxy-3-oxopropionate reductase